MFSDKISPNKFALPNAEDNTQPQDHETESPLSRIRFVKSWKKVFERGSTYLLY